MTNKIDKQVAKYMLVASKNLSKASVLDDRTLALATLINLRSTLDSYVERLIDND